jgi:hypothetical protein
MKPGAKAPRRVPEPSTTARGTAKLTMVSAVEADAAPSPAAVR